MASARRRTRLTTARIIAVLVLLTYPAAAAVLVLTRNGWAVNRLNVRIWSATLGPGGLRLPITPEQFADLANVVLFLIPFAALALLMPSWWWILLGTAVSSCIETAQYYRGGRDATIVDVLTNTIGAALGVALGRILHQRLSSAGSSPTAVGTRAESARATRDADPRATAPAPDAAPDDQD